MRLTPFWTFILFLLGCYLFVSGLPALIFLYAIIKVIYFK